MRSVTVAIFHVLCVLVGPWALVARSEQPELKDNQWVEIDDGGAGARIGPAVAWMPKEKKFLVVGGFKPITPTRRRPYDVQTFDPATGRWQDCFPKGMEKAWVDSKGNATPPEFPHSNNYVSLLDRKKNKRLTPSVPLGEYFAFDAEANVLYVALGGHTLRGTFANQALPVVRYNVRERTWEVLSGSGPPVKPEYGEMKMSNTRLVMDPVNNELLFLGGWGPGLKNGTAGSWAFAPGTRKWRKLDSPSLVLDPLFAQAQKAEAKARDAVAAARNVFYQGLGGSEESASVKKTPAVLIADARDLTAALIERLNAANGQGWEKEAIARAQSLTKKALVELQAASSGFSDGKLNASLIKQAFDAVWNLDLAAECLRSSPPSRVSPAAAYDPVNQVVVQSGGSHWDYVSNDTWIYDCKTRKWRQVWAKVCPAPRKGASLVYLPKSKRLALVGGESANTEFSFYRTYVSLPTDVWTYDASSNQWHLLFREEITRESAKKRIPLSSPLAVSDQDVMLGLFTEKRDSRGQGNWNYCSKTRLFRLSGKGNPTLTAKHGVEAGSRTYLSVVPAYNPCWYDAAPRGDLKKTEAWYKAMKPNTWLAPPKAPRVCPPSEWGTAVYDPQRDAMYLWSGGHQSDCSNLVHIFHPAINRWSIPYVPGGAYQVKGRSFNNRPPAGNHTYLTYTYDPYSQRMVAGTAGGIAVYNPDRRDWEYVGASPIAFRSYYSKLCGTSRGVVVWTNGFLGLFDAKKKSWKDLPTSGVKLPGYFHGDKNILVWDSKRDVLYCMAMTNYRTANGQIWRYDLESGKVTVLNPGKQQTIGTSMHGIREAVYLPKLDLVLFNNFLDDQQIAYNPKDNSFVLLDIAPAGRMGNQANSNLIYDSRRDLLWGLCGGNEVRALRIDPKLLKLSAKSP